MKCRTYFISVLLLLIPASLFAGQDLGLVEGSFNKFSFLAGNHLNHFFTEGEAYFLIRLFVAVFLGCLMGFSHSFKRPHASGISLRTFGAVSLGAAAFSSIYIHLFLATGGSDNGPLVNLGTITSGIGFLCAAVIFKQGLTVKGLSTAATLWASAAVGAACGCNMFGIGLVTTFLIAVLHRFEPKEAKTAKKVSELPD